MFGFLNLNKPSGFSSHDCVAKVRRMLGIRKVGHGGTLDPLATGVLPIAVGKATRLLQFLPEEKVYLAKIRLGVKTTTDDLEGEVIGNQSGSELTLAAVEPILGEFRGKIEQIPPAYSAIQRQGKRLYELARAGEKVDVPARIVTISKIEVLAWYPGENPELEVVIACGPGTYIRSIARDIGDKLGVGGTLANLIRTESCSFKLADSLTFEELQAQLQAETFQLVSLDSPLQHIPSVTLPAPEAKRWCQGQKVTDWQGQEEKSLIFHRVYHQDRQFLGIAELVDNQLVPKVVSY